VIDVRMSDILAERAVSGETADKTTWVRNALDRSVPALTV